MYGDSNYDEILKEITKPFETVPNQSAEDIEGSIIYLSSANKMFSDFVEECLNIKHFDFQRKMLNQYKSSNMIVLPAFTPKFKRGLRLWVTYIQLGQLYATMQDEDKVCTCQKGCLKELYKEDIKRMLEDYWK